MKDETLATESVRQMPELGERREDRPLVDGCPMAMDGTPFLRPLCPQGTACVRTVEMRLGPRTHPGSSTSRSGVYGDIVLAARS